MTHTIPTLTDEQHAIALEHAKATRALAAQKITPDEYRAGNADRRDRAGDLGMWEIVKSHALAMAYNGKA
jgi:hypothetical protein